MRIVLVVLFLMSFFVLNAQSKKEQIQILSNRLDSSLSVSKKQENEILELNSELTNTKDQLDKLNKENSDLYSKKSNLEIQLKDKNNVIKKLQDSLNESIRNKLPPQDLYSYSFDRIYSDKIEEHLKKLVVKYPTYPESDDRYYTRKNTTVLDTRLFLENNKMKALLITLDRIPINNDTRPQLNINFFIIDCQNIDNPSILYNWSSLLPECFADHDSDIIDIQFTDLNNDRNVEVWAVNEKFCMSGVDLTELLIFKYENGKHCTLESMTNSHYIIDPEINTSMDDDFIRNTYEKEPLIFDQCFSNSDAVFINYAKHLREKNIYGKGGFRFYNDGNDNPKFWSREDSQKTKIIKENKTEENSYSTEDILEKLKNNLPSEPNGEIEKIDTSKVLQKIKELSYGCLDCYWFKSIDHTYTEDLYFIHVVDLDHLYFVYNQVEYLIPLKQRSFKEGKTQTGQPLNSGKLTFEGSGFTITSNWSNAGLSFGSFGEVEVKLKDKVITQMSTKCTFSF